jgi:hypothetical protein
MPGPLTRAKAQRRCRGERGAWERPGWSLAVLEASGAHWSLCIGTFVALCDPPSHAGKHEDSRTKAQSHKGSAPYLFQHVLTNVATRAEVLGGVAVLVPVPGVGLSQAKEFFSDRVFCRRLRGGDLASCRHGRDRGGGVRRGLASSPYPFCPCPCRMSSSSR